LVDGKLAGAILFCAHVFPSLCGEGGGIGGELFIKLDREGELDSLAGDFHGGGKRVHGLGVVTDALETCFFRGIRLPTSEADNEHGSIGMKDGTLSGGGELDGKFYDAALIEAIGDLLAEDVIDGRLTVREVEEFARGDADLGIFFDPDLAAAGVVDIHRKIDQGLCEFTFVPLAGVLDSEEGNALGGLVIIDFTAGLPSAFVFSGGDFTVGVEAFSIGADFNEGAIVWEDFVKASSACEDGGAFGEVEVSFLICFEAELEFVEVVREVDVVVEDFEFVGFVIVVKIVYFIDAIAACNVGDVVKDFEAEGFKESGGVTFPSEVFHFFEPAEEPDVAIPSGEESAVAIGKEVDV